MIYIDVILPLPLEGLFTYSVHAKDAHKAVVGKRVVVPLGRSKTYTGIIERVHNTKPSFDTRDAIDFPDALPVVLEKQLDLWKWIAHYYMTPLGDVYKAAVPAGLKAEEGYRPRTETYVQLYPSYQSKEGLSRAISLVKRANKQLQMLECYLSISHWNDALQGDNAQEISEITRVELMNVSNGNAAALQGLTGKGILTTYEQEVTRLNTSNNEQTIRTKVLSAAQQDAYNKILMQWMKRDIVLLHGVTSSGKTEVYIHLIQNALEKHQQVLYILPEIALTVQITQRLQRIFGNQLGIYHSKYNDAERVEIWKKQLSDNPYKVILGVRSSVFLPFQNLGLIIIDEEHETSFKQQDPAPRYHARSVAVMLAKMYNAKTLLGTATPSMESYYNACQGKYGLVELTTRFKDIALPKIEIIDVKDLRRRKIMKGIFSQPLVDAVQQAIDEGKQAILFQNRRGFAPMLECKECGWVPKCQNCDVSLTIHKNMNHLSCHYCGFTYLIPSSCPKCGCTELRSKGYGTEKIEELVNETFQGARISRMDLDTTRTKNAYERIINDFSQGRTNILIGTQMITKGLDFDKVKVVGIIDADSILNYPDFRSYEYAFMMMGQVAGRAGRKGEQGRVILQTKNADMPIISQIANNDFKTFYNDTLEERMMFKYPPFYRLIYIYIKHKHEKVAEGAANVLAGRLRSWFGERLLGPDRPSIARVKDLHIRKLMLKLELGLNGNDVREYLRMAQAELLNNKPYAAIQIYYDIDPM
ncbi:primosomal protein N' [Prevotella sp. oral taxon 299]|uniref:replication restart helicase PriA n=1 Tax=Prevotella sp. oral taxon 299 TaxID=652716 RepID=UPI0001C404B2|nr:primosomal protein N' [Prevotella sp. oral taxon 299]EFC70484.1 primosomal protein N' [Prevotella sp. oral taxon 299 str. F0039]